MKPVTFDADFEARTPGYYGRAVHAPDGTFHGVEVLHIREREGKVVWWCHYYNCGHVPTAWRMARRVFPRLRKIGRKKPVDEVANQDV